MSAEGAARRLAELVIYGRENCHLCDDMESALRRLAGELRFELRFVDVDADPALAERHGSRVPVLALGETEICHYFLDEAALRARLSEIR